MKICTALLSIALITGSASLSANDDDKEEATVEVRLAAAKKLLSESSQISLVYVKGLVCPSCAIGIRKNLSKMEGVDKKRFRDGIDMNPETQLVTIALKKDAQIEVKEVLERVDDAGYDAIEKYKLHDGHLDAHKFKKDASVEVVHHTPHK
ncbi:heavy-metal-associated domain-containing protein [Verrucomicrobia bacterium]|nr:heavy-metal-associated domain-containing protein [Verrucomicrobiota bacterium]